MVEPRREQAAEVVPIPLLWRGARQGGVVESRLEPAAERSPGWTYSELPIFNCRVNILQEYRLARPGKLSKMRLERRQRVVACVFPKVVSAVRDFDDPCLRQDPAPLFEFLLPERDIVLRPDERGRPRGGFEVPLDIGEPAFGAKDLAGKTCRGRREAGGSKGAR